MKSIRLTLVSLLSCCLISLGCLARTNATTLGYFPEIKLYVSKNQYQQLQKTTSDKLALTHAVMMMNQDTVQVKEIHARGNNSLKFKRKSLSVELNKAVSIEVNGKKIHLKKFNLLNLVMDKQLWHNRWSNLNLTSAGIFPLFNSYCTVWINDEPQGIFLLVEKPQHALTKLKSPYMLRRGPDHTISDEYFDNDDKELAKKYKKQFLSIYSGINSLGHDALVNHLNTVMNLNHYFQYLGFNYLIMNGDYADEVFLYIEPKNQWFEVIPWDYDDILKPVPHEGRTLRNKEFADKKLFSLEERLDRAIAGNDALYSQYLNTLKSLLITLDSATLVQSTNQVIHELEQLSADKAMTEVTLFLDSNPFDIQQAKADMMLSLDFILKRRKWILEDLK